MSANALRSAARAGDVVIVFRPYTSPGEELEPHLSGRPWQHATATLYRTEQAQDEDIDLEEHRTSLPAAVSAIAEDLSHRLEVLAWVLGAMQDIGWRLTLEGDLIVASRLGTRTGALAELEDAGILGPMSKVVELDEHGMPLIRDRWEL